MARVSRRGEIASSIPGRGILEYESPRRFFLVAGLAIGEPIRIRLTSGRYGQTPRS